MLKEETVQLIKERLEEDIEAFKKLTGISISDWKTYNSIMLKQQA